MHAPAHARLPPNPRVHAYMWLPTAPIEPRGMPDCLLALLIGRSGWGSWILQLWL